MITAERLHALRHEVGSPDKTDWCRKCGVGWRDHERGGCGIPELLDIIEKYRAHANAAWTKFNFDIEEVQRLASLFDHDMARPSSTNGELALASAVRWLVSKLKITQEKLKETNSPARFPLQIDDKKFRPGDPSWVPWAIAELAYNTYVNRFGRSQTLDRLAERGGFSIGEMDMFLPNWREMVGLGHEISRLKTQNETLQNLLELVPVIDGNKVGEWELEPTGWKNHHNQPTANLSYGTSHDLFHMMAPSELLMLAALFVKVSTKMKEQTCPT